MQIKCGNCGAYFESTETTCPFCGEKNEMPGEGAAGTPQPPKRPETIEEMQAWCNERGLTPQKTRFFVGQNYLQPKAFGIYRDESGNFIVYKNKADGTRAVRYEGPDEAHAVGELFDRLQQEVENQKRYHASKRRSSGSSGGGSVRGGKKRRSSFIGLLPIILVAIMMIGSYFMTRDKIKRGYYSYGDDLYYCLADTWYLWDIANESWGSASAVPEELSETPSDYFSSDTYRTTYASDRFEDTYTYKSWEADQKSHNNDDDDDDWDYDDWDFGGTDWDSDW